MADEKKTSEETVAVVQEKVRGDRGHVGEATAASTLKHQWREAGSPMSLKRWARLQAKDGNQSAKEWFANKAGAKNESRSDKNVKRIFEEKQASKAARKKAGAGKQAKPKADAAPAAK